MAALPRLYLDWNASAPLCEEARLAMVDAMALTGNPSSVHGEGRALRGRIEAARKTIADRFAVAPRQVIFTSGATEAAALALSPVLRAGSGELAFDRLLASAVEHPCVLAGGRFAAGTVERIGVDRAGIVDGQALESALARPGRSMVAVMAANNETGVVQPIGDIARIVHAHGGVLVVDAVQAMGRIDPRRLVDGADFLILSSHKIGGPAGAGALICLQPGLVPMPMLSGGGQEHHNRAGTENAVAIAGFAAAIARMAEDGILWRNSEARDFFEQGIAPICRKAGTSTPVIFGAGAERLPNTSCLSVPGLSAETALIALDLAGIAGSSGSACSSGKVKTSHVLQAMGVADDLARGALRISFGPDQGQEQAGRLLGALQDIVGRMAGSKAA